MKDVKLTIRHESWLVDSQLHLQQILELVYLWSQSFSVDEIVHELQISNKTVIEWIHFFRECCFTTMIESSEKIGGNSIEIEVDESKFGKRKYYHGHRVEGQWVFGGREKYNKKQGSHVALCRALFGYLECAKVSKCPNIKASGCVM